MKWQNFEHLTTEVQTEHNQPTLKVLYKSVVQQSKVSVRDQLFKSSDFLLHHIAPD